MDGPTATLIASALATAVAVIGFAAVVYFRLGRLEGRLIALEGNLDRSLDDNRELTKVEIVRLSDKVDAFRTETKADNARLSENMEADNARLSDKVDSDVARLSDKVDALRTETKADNARLSDKIDSDVARLSDKMEADNARLSDKIDSDVSRLSDKVDALRAETKADNTRLSEKMDAQHAETMAAINRLTDAFLSHSHDDDGNIMFRIPPGGRSE